MKNIFLILLLASTTLAATKYLQGDAVKSLDLTKTWTMPAANDTLVGKASTDTLTNKTIDADGTGNSITNIENADIKAGAAIAYSKLNLGGSIISTDLSAAIPIAYGGTGATTKAAAFDALSPMTTSGDIIYGGASGTGTRLAIGATGTVLTASGTTLAWTAPLVNPMTTGGDIIYGGASGAVTRLANGSAGQLLQSNGSTNAPSWTTTIIAPTVSGDLTLSAGGIVFPATQVASANANTLDDYEEGTFTPTVIGTSVAGAGTYNTQVGSYTKVGNVVHIVARVDISAHTGTGSIRLGGFPFTSSATNAAGVIGYVNTLALTASNFPTILANGSATTAEIYQYPVGGGSVTNVAMDTSFNMYYSLTYLAAN